MVLTGAAVLRASLRMFAGLSGAPGPERGGPTEREHEKDDRPLWLMLLPGALLVALACMPATVGMGWSTRAMAVSASALPAEAMGERFGRSSPRWRS